jgi:hypothetical protein
VVKEPTGESVTLTGVVQRVTSKEIEILIDPPAKGDAKQKNKKAAPQGTWTVATPRATKFHVQSEATPDYLHSGLLVQLDAKPEGQEIKEPIHQLTIVSKGHPKQAMHSGSKPANLGSGPAATASAAGSPKIVGQLGHTQANQWLVHVGEKSYRIQLADDLTIKVAFSNGHLIGAGDKIVVHGEAIQGRPGTCIADDVQVTLAHPLSAKAKSKSSEHEPAVGPSDKQ